MYLKFLMYFHIKMKKEDQKLKKRSKIQKQINILFVCKANRFRSKIAEAYFKKINKNPNLQVKSAGIISGSPPISSRTKKILNSEFNLIIKGNPKPVTKEILDWADLVIIVADDVPPAIFDKRHYKGKLLVWKIKDAYHHDEKEIRQAARQIIFKIDGFVRNTA